MTSMQTFIRIVEAGSISSAADELGQSSQLTGKQLRALEQWLGIQLISRTIRESDRRRKNFLRKRPRDPGGS
ncbi:LysR family transcriptional regulator [Candidatus Pantoea formicae]|uniref:helix-turn-helix domain-containing protein n=1 Tax=Candidatus Pantoea formicae TaxID=2608355 RepID=UPI003EDAFDDF